MRRAVLQVWNQNVDWLAQETEPAMRRWCASNGWDLSRKRLDGSAVHDSYYLRYPEILEALKAYDRVLYLDLDVVPVRNVDFIPATDLNVHISQDPWGWCAGAMLIDNGPWGIAFATAMTHIIPKRLAYRLQEQDVLKQFLAIPTVGSQVYRIGEELVSCPDSRLGVEPVFHHLWANSADDRMLRVLRDAVSRFMSA